MLSSKQAVHPVDSPYAPSVKRKLLHTTFAALLFILCLTSWTSQSQATWNLVAQFPQGLVTAMYFFDEITGFVGFGTTNGISRTTDGGVTWTPCSIPAWTATQDPWIGDIWFLNRTEGWATRVYGDFGKFLLHTTDGGSTWTADFKGGGCAVRQTTHALVVTQYAGGGISTSTDGGRTLTQRTSGGVDGVDFVDDLHGATSGFVDQFMFTSDGGLTWQPSVTNYVNEAWGIYGAKGTSKFFAVPEDNAFQHGSFVYRSTDYGVNWDPIVTLPFKSTGDVKGYRSTLYVQKLTGAGPDGLYRSTDDGLTWTNVGGPSCRIDTRFVVTGCGSVLYAADAMGGIYKSTDGGDGQLVGAGPNSNVRLSLGLSSDPIAIGDTLAIVLMPNVRVQGTGLHSITGLLEYFDDAFDFASIVAAPGLTFTLGRPRRFGKTARVPFTITSTSDITLDPSTPIFTARMKSVLSDSLSTFITIDSLLVNGNDPSYGDCKLSAETEGITSRVTLVCGDSTIQGYLRHQPLLLSIGSAYPNPVTTASNGLTSITLRSAEKGIAEITIMNMLGEALKVDRLELQSGSVKNYTIDLSHFVSGTYFYNVKLKANGKLTNAHGSIILFK